MTYDVISRLAGPSVESKVELVSYLIHRLKRQKTNKEFSDSIQVYLSEREKFSYLSSYCMVGPKYALGCLVGHFLIHYVEEKDIEAQKRFLTELLKFLKGFRNSKNSVLKQTTANNLLDTIDKFGMPKHFLRTFNSRPLRIYFIPYEHADVNAGYYPHLNTIVSYRPRKKDLSPEYIFVHEVGHLLTFNLTGDPDKVPESFVEFSKKYNPSWDKGLVEIFVDLFSLAVMMDTEYAGENPFIKKFSIGNQKIVRDYFIRLMENLTYKDKAPVSFDFRT